MKRLATLLSLCVLSGCDAMLDDDPAIMQVCPKGTPCVDVAEIKARLESRVAYYRQPHSKEWTIMYIDEFSVDDMMKSLDGRCVESTDDGTLSGKVLGLFSPSRCV